MLIVIYLVVLATHYAHRYIPGGLGHPLCSSLYTWWSWPPIMLIVIYLVVLATHYAQNYASIINQALTVTCILELSLRTMLSSLGFLISISPCIRYFTGLVYSAQSHCLTGYLQQQGCFISTPDMVTSLMLLLQEKHSKACFDEYYSKAQVECRIKEWEIPSPMCMDRWVSSIGLHGGACHTRSGSKIPPPQWSNLSAPGTPIIHTGTCSSPFLSSSLIFSKLCTDNCSKCHVKTSTSKCVNWTSSTGVKIMFEGGQSRHVTLLLLMWI